MGWWEKWDGSGDGWDGWDRWDGWIGWVEWVEWVEWNGGVWCVVRGVVVCGVRWYYLYVVDRELGRVGLALLAEEDHVEAKA